MLDNQEQAAGYLGGIIDGEGYICNAPRNRHIEITNTDPSIIQNCMEACGMLGITYRLYKRTPSQNNTLREGKVEYRFGIYGKINMIIIRDRCPLCERKEKTLKEAINSFVRKMKQPETKLLGVEELV